MNFNTAFGIDAKVDPSKRIPVVGDKVILSDEFYETLSDGKEAMRLARLPYCTIESVLPVPIGENGDYTYEYEIYVEETGYMVGFSYTFYEE